LGAHFFSPLSREIVHPGVWVWRDALSNA